MYAYYRIFFIGDYHSGPLGVTSLYFWGIQGLDSGFHSKIITLISCLLLPWMLSIAYTSQYSHKRKVPELWVLNLHEKVFGYLYPYIMEKCYMYVIIGCSITLLLYFTIMLFSSSSPMVEASLVSTERPLDLGAAKQNTVSVYPLRPPVKRPPVKRPPVKCSSVKLYFFK